MVYSDTFASYYDPLMGDYTRLITSVHKLVKMYVPPQKKLRILELACGTGTILKTFPKAYELYGLDIAKGMIEIARKKVPQAKFFVADMSDFSFPQKFDVILCVFDSINHLTQFSKWEKVFRLAAKHLTQDGVFIFDMNTPKRLHVISTFPPMVKRVNKDTLSFEKLSQYKKNVYTLQVIILEKSNARIPTLREELIKEAVFGKEKIIQSLQKRFVIQKLYDPFRKKVTKNTGRIFFVCKRRKLVKNNK